ncbi:MAG: DinB family protein [Paenibacillus sp.]|jgi:uncharacterized damage-inducible protein DinB|nr:DinB family protein [Paenibacillus sp.]
MSQVFEIRDHLLHELEHGVKTTQRLVSRITPEQWSYRPKGNMRTLQELTRHLVMVPATDMAILQEKKGPEFDRIEGDVESVTDPRQLCELMQQSYESLKAYMTSLDEDHFLNLSTKPFYSDQGSVQVKWLIEIVTHVFHHRAQLFNYLKELGHDINMFVLY